MRVFKAFARPTVFISASRDMRLEASMVLEIVEEIRRNSPLHRNLDCFLWSNEDTPWFADSTWQEQIPRPSDPMVVAVICLFGERLGTPLPSYFPLPDDLTLPQMVRFPWQEGSKGIPLTGTLFEYLDARRRADMPENGTRRPPMMVYLRADATTALSNLPADQRNWGYWRHYEEVSQSRRRSDIDEYFHQIGYVTHFADEILKPQERGCAFLGPDPEEFRKLLRRDLASALDLSAARKAISALKGLEAYDVGDSEFFCGRTRTIDKIFREIERKDAAPEGCTGALIVGASGAGKSSVLRAGIIGEAIRGIRNTLGRSLRAAVVTPHQLGEQPLAALGAILAEQGVLPELGRADDLQKILAADPAQAPALLIDRIEEACAAAADAEERKSRFGLRPQVRLILALDQIDQMVEPDADVNALAPLLRFVIEGVRRRAFWFIGSLADSRLSRWNRMLGDTNAAFEYWPLSNPDWEALSDIVDSSFDQLKLPIDKSLKETLISTCREMDREGTAILPLLSVAMTRLSEELRKKCAAVAREALPSDASPGGAFWDGHLLEITLPAEAIDELKTVADVKSAIEQLAEQAWREACYAAQKDGRSQFQEIGPLFRHLVAVRPGATTESISLVQRHAGSPAITRHKNLIDALRKKRILTDVGEDQVQIVHESVVRHWPRAAEWFDQTQKALRFIETIKPLADMWAAADPELKDSMVLPVGYCLQALHVQLDWREDTDQLPMEFLRASFLQHAHNISGLSTQNGWSPLGVAVLLGEAELAKAYLSVGADISRGGPEGTTPLHLADNTGILAALLEHGGDVHARDDAGSTPLHIAADKGLRDIALSLLQAGGDPRAVNSAGNTPLHLAAERASIELAELLLRHAPDIREDVNLHNAAGSTPFTIACKSGHDEMMSLLLAHGADVHVFEKPTSPGQESKMPLLLAVESNKPRAVEVLINSGASSDASIALQALFIAASRGSSEIVDQLVACGAPVHAINSTGHTPLHLAAEGGHHRIVQTLLQAGAGINAVSENGTSVLHAATASKNVETVAILLSHGTALDKVTVQGETALHFAALSGSAEILHHLLDSGAASSIEDAFGFSALGRAVDNSRIDCATALIEAEGRLLKPNAIGLTPLHIAARNGDIKMLDLLAETQGELPETPEPLLVFAVHSTSHDTVHRLLERGAPVNAADPRGMTALMYAAWNGDEKIVELLLSRGADPNQKGPDAWTALMFAAAAARAKQDAAQRVITRLVDSGAILETCDRFGRTALSIARQCGLEILSALLERLADESEKARP